MSLPTGNSLFEALDATWPAARAFTVGDFVIRDGAGGGKRVSAASHSGEWTGAAIDAAEAAMDELGQARLFMVRGENHAFDTELEARGYGVVDPVVLYLAASSDLAGPVPAVSVFHVWEPLAIQCEIWAAGGIGPERVAVMERAQGPKTSLFGRMENRPAGTGFIACHGDVAMVHALEVLEPMRGKGMGRLMMVGAANWAMAQGASALALAVTRANASANGLYASMGMRVVEQYHYRVQG